MTSPPDQARINPFGGRRQRIFTTVEAQPTSTEEICNARHRRGRRRFDPSLRAVGAFGLPFRRDKAGGNPIVERRVRSHEERSDLDMGLHPCVAVIATGGGAAVNEDDNPMSKAPMRPHPRCTATSKRTGERCKGPTVKGWRVCRFHGRGRWAARRPCRL